jgi:hypothetical protein
MLLVTPFSAMAGKYETILTSVIEKKVESERGGFIAQLEVILPVAQKKFEEQSMKLSGNEKLKAEVKVQLVKDLIIDLAIVKPNYMSEDTDSSEEMTNDNTEIQEEQEEASHEQGDEESESSTYG